jgi:xanthine dehydrogenase/oxidase
MTQRAVAQVTGMDQGKVCVSVMRLGGAYGGKITRCLTVSTITALAANLTQRPVRNMLDLNTNMKMIGKRHPFRATYSVGYSSAGLLQAVKLDFHVNCGNSGSDAIGAASIALTACDNAYYCPNWLVTPYLWKTSTPANTATRAPGSYPAIYFIEMIMDHVAQAANIAPEELRQMNMYGAGQVTPYGAVLTYCSVKDIFAQVLGSSDFDKRKAAITTFNSSNRWVKKGIAIAPIKYGIGFAGAPFSATLSVFADGTIQISHGGIEMGQGLMVKASQVVAYKFSVPIDQITVLPSNSFNAPLNSPTGGSVGSELTCMVISNACDTLLQRMLPVRSTLVNPTWKQWVAACGTLPQPIEMCARGYVATASTGVFNYQSYGAVVTEVQIDVITGEVQVPRVDLLFDCGQSLNPAIDVGQVEGGFVMGLGYMTCEDVVFDPTTGGLLTDGTWEYKIPSSKDIPIDFRVKFLFNAPNPSGFLGFKASGEPPLCLTGTVLSAMKMCI